MLKAKGLKSLGYGNLPLEMEHLLGPRALARYGNQIEAIPWLGFDHDGTRPFKKLNGPPVQEFLAYPSQRGFKSWSRGDIPFPTLHDDATLAMLQSWFFFGLWESVFQQRLAVNDYVFDCGGHKVLRTPALRRRVHLLVEDTSQWTGDRTETFKSQLQSTCRQASKLYTNLALHQNTSNIELNETQSAKVDAILRMTILSLEHIEISIVQRMLASHVYRSDLQISDSHQRLIEERLRKNNWCPLAFEYLRKFNYSSAEYASLIHRRGSPNQHGKCSRRACVARNVDDHSSVPTHASNPCDCEFWYPPLAELFDILRRGEVPLLSSNAILGREGHASDQVMAYKIGMKFTAFSHVWADGLGSTSEKGLPYCQVERLCQKVDSDYFWVDALCIPRDESLRKASIRSMAWIYRQADMVLVLDAGLQLELTEALDLEELVVKILTSDWNQRLWTLQEGALSKSLQFECKDSRVPVDTLLGCFTPTWDGYHTPIASWFEALGNLWRAVNADKPSKEAKGNGTFEENILPLGMAINLLGNRSSSRLSDEPFAIAPLLGVDVNGLIDKVGDERMEKLFLDLHCISTRSVFSHSHKLEKPGFRWAPKSLIDSGGDYDLFSRQDQFPGIATVDGLRGKQLVIAFEREVTVDSEAIGDYRIRDRMDEWEYLLCPFPDIEGVAETHHVTSIAICADFPDHLSSENLYDVVGLRATGALNEDNVPIYELQGHFMLTGGDKPIEIEAEQGQLQDIILASAPQAQEIIIS